MSQTNIQMQDKSTISVNEEAQNSEGFKLRFCTVCASNQNRYVTLRFDT